MNDKISKIKVNISQKMNLGNYETRDYIIGLEIEGFDNSSKEKIQEAIDFGRDICTTEAGEYYRKVKNRLDVAGAKQGVTDSKYAALETRIQAAGNEDELRSLTEEVTAIEDEKDRNAIQKLFNIKLIQTRTK